MSCETFISSIYFNAESSAGGLLPYCLWLMHFITVSFHFQCSSEDTRRRMRRREMTRRNDKKRKFRYWVVLVKKPWQRPAVLRFLLTSKNGLSYMGKGKALLFYETHLTSSALKVFLVVVNLKVSRYQHKSCGISCLVSNAHIYWGFTYPREDTKFTIECWWYRSLFRWNIKTQEDHR